jgi:hypothetical protein
MVVTPIPVFRLLLAFEMGEVTVVAVIFGRPGKHPLRGHPSCGSPYDSCRSSASGFFRPDPDVCRPDGDRPENWCLLTFPPVRLEPRPAEMNLHNVPLASNGDRCGIYRWALWLGSWQF